MINNSFIGPHRVADNDEESSQAPPDGAPRPPDHSHGAALP